MYTGWNEDNIRSTAITILPNGTVIGSPPLPDGPGDIQHYSFGGPHPGGWMSVFCDGSVHFLSYEMNPLVHRDLGNRQDGNTIDESQL